MALQIKNAHIQYYHMDAIWSVLLGYSYFPNSYYLAIKIVVSTVIQHSDSELLNGLQVDNLTRFFPGVVRYTPQGVAYHCIVAIIDLVNHFVITTYPAP